MLTPQDIVVFTEAEQAVIADLVAKIDTAIRDTRGDVAISITNTPRRVVYEITRRYEENGWNVSLGGRQNAYGLYVRHPRVAMPDTFERVDQGAVWVLPRGAIKYDGSALVKPESLNE